MLIELRIRDFAVVRDLTLSLGPGLNVLTGETGAGKSIIVDALSLLLGERASSADVRVGSDRALVEAVFDVSGIPDATARLEELGMSAPDGLLILRREVQAEGRNRAWVNGSPATAGTVGALGGALVDLHGQHEHQTLLRRTAQRELLDAFAGAEELAEEVREAHRTAQGAARALELHRARLSELSARADFIRFQLDEIRKARLHRGEEQELESEASRLAHSQELASELARVHDVLYGGDDAVSDRLAEIARRLEREVRLDPSLEPLRELVESALQTVQEAGQRAGDYAAGVEHDPARLQALQERRDLLFKLKRKYGPELEDVLDTERRLALEARELDEADRDAGALEAAARAAIDALHRSAGALTEARTGAARELARRVEEVLPELGMPGARVEIALLPDDEPGPGGAETVEFRVSLNEGFEPRGLGRVASGGELSRVMLALKTVLAEADRVPTLVFDEIDAGVGGTVAHGVARTLAEVARHHQVFVITHLPQVASRARAHLLVEKGSASGITETRVSVLEGEERVREVARMLGSDARSAAGLDHARELLKAGGPIAP